MPSTNKTERFELNRWEGTDRPQRNDFNADNLIIDQVLGEHVDNGEIHLTDTEKARVTRPMIIVGYQGDGEPENMMTLPVVVTTVIVYCDDMPPAVYDSALGCVKIYSAISMYGGGSTAGLTFNGSKITVTHGTESSAEGYVSYLNEAGRQYKVIGFR